LLVRHSRRIFSLALLLRRRSIAGAALSRRQFTPGFPHRPPFQCARESADAISDPASWRDGLSLLPIRKAAHLFQSAELPARGRERLPSEVERTPDPVRRRLRAETRITPELRCASIHSGTSATRFTGARHSRR